MVVDKYVRNGHGRREANENLDAMAASIRQIKISSSLKMKKIVLMG